MSGAGSTFSLVIAFRQVSITHPRFCRHILTSSASIEAKAFSLGHILVKVELVFLKVLYIYKYTYVCIHIHLKMYMYSSISMYMYLVCMCIHKRPCMYESLMYVSMYVCIRYMYLVCMSIHKHTCMYESLMYVCMYICIRTDRKK